MALSGEVPLMAVATRSVIQLYLDEALPRSRLLQWRVETAVGRKVSATELRNAVRTAPGLVVQPSDCTKSNFVVLLEKAPSGFSGFSDSLTDPLPEEFWPDVSECFEAGGWPVCGNLENQPFVIADWLRRAGERISWLSFGRSLAVVRDSLTVHKLLGKRAGQVVLYRKSEEYEKRINMGRRMPTGVAVGERYVATWWGLRKCLARLLQDHGGCLAVSRLKPLFRECFGAELSETTFGHASMVELLMSADLADAFEVIHGEKGAAHLKDRGMEEISTTGLERGFVLLAAPPLGFRPLAAVPPAEVKSEKTLRDPGPLRKAVQAPEGSSPKRSPLRRRHLAKAGDAAGTAEPLSPLAATGAAIATATRSGTPMGRARFAQYLTMTPLKPPRGKEVKLSEMLGEPAKAPSEPAQAQAKLPGKTGAAIPLPETKNSLPLGPPPSHALKLSDLLQSEIDVQDMPKATQLLVLPTAASSQRRTQNGDASCSPESKEEPAKPSQFLVLPKAASPQRRMQPGIASSLPGPLEDPSPMAARASGRSAATQLKRRLQDSSPASPSPLPPWCVVRWTFVEVPPVPDHNAELRACSVPARRP